MENTAAAAVNDDKQVASPREGGRWQMEAVVPTPTRLVH